MKKQVILRGLIGIPIGICISYFITIIISLIFAHGYYSPAAPSLTQQLGSEISAVIFQTVLSGILGAVFAASSVIWETDWNIAKQTGIYFLITSITMLPIAYLTHWMEHSITGFLIYFGIFVLFYLIIWIVQYLIWKNKIKQINDKVTKG